MIEAASCHRDLEGPPARDRHGDRAAARGGATVAVHSTSRILHGMMMAVSLTRAKTSARVRGEFEASPRPWPGSRADCCHCLLTP